MVLLPVLVALTLDLASGAVGTGRRPLKYTGLTEGWGWGEPWLLSWPFLRPAPFSARSLSQLHLPSAEPLPRNL